MIDIIIPVYNTPIDDLKRCFNSIINQSYNNYIVYVIDDGSNLETKDFLDEFALNNNKFKVYHTINKGVSYARNLGIDISNNEYITFIDSDDTVEKDFLYEAIKYIKEYNLDVIIGGYNEIVNGSVTRIRKCEPGIHIYEGNNKDRFFEKLLSTKVNESNKEIKDAPIGRVYTRVFRRDSFNNLKFNESIKVSEDVLFMVDYMEDANRIGLCDKVWYNYYINDYSIINGTDNELLIKYVEDFIVEIKKRYNKEYKVNIKDAYYKRIIKAENYINELRRH